MTEVQFQTLTAAELFDELRKLGRPMDAGEVEAIAGMGVLPVASIEADGYPIFALVQLVDALAIRGAGDVDALRRRAGVLQAAFTGVPDALSKAHRELREALAERGVLGELHRLLPVLEPLALDTLRGDARLEWRLRQSLNELSDVLASDRFRDATMTPVFGPGRPGPPAGRATAQRPAPRAAERDRPSAESAQTRPGTSVSDTRVDERPVAAAASSDEVRPSSAHEAVGEDSKIAVAEPYRLGPEDRHPPNYRPDGGVRMPVLRDDRASKTTSAPHGAGGGTDAFRAAGGSPEPRLVDDARELVEAGAGQGIGAEEDDRSLAAGRRDTPSGGERSSSRDEPSPTRSDAVGQVADPDAAPATDQRARIRTRELGVVPPRTSLDHARRAALRRGATTRSRSESRPTTESDPSRSKADRPVWNLPEPLEERLPLPVRSSEEGVEPPDLEAAVVAGLAVADAHRRGGRHTSEEEALEGLLESLPVGVEQLTVVRRLAAVYITRAGGSDAAIELYRHTVESGVFDEKIVHALTSLLRAAGRHDELFDVLWTAAERSDAADASRYLRSAARAANELIDDDDVAMAVLERANESAPDDTEVLAELANRCRRIGDELAEINALEQAVEHGREHADPEVLVRLAELQLSRPRGAARAADLLHHVLDLGEWPESVAEHMPDLVMDVADKADDLPLELRWRRRRAADEEDTRKLLDHLRRIVEILEAIDSDAEDRVWTVDAALEAAATCSLEAAETVSLELAAARARRAVGHWNTAIEHAAKAASIALEADPGSPESCEAVSIVSDVAGSAIDERPALEMLSNAADTGEPGHRAAYARALSHVGRWDDATAILEELVDEADEGSEAHEDFSAQLERVRMRLEVS